MEVKQDRLKNVNRVLVIWTILMVLVASGGIVVTAQQRQEIADASAVNSASASSWDNIGDAIDAANSGIANAASNQQERTSQGNVIDSRNNDIARAVENKNERTSQGNVIDSRNNDIARALENKKERESQSNTVQAATRTNNNSSSGSGNSDSSQSNNNSGSDSSNSSNSNSSQSGGNSSSSSSGSGSSSSSSNSSSSSSSKKKSNSKKKKSSKAKAASGTLVPPESAKSRISTIEINQTRSTVTDITPGSNLVDLAAYVTLYSYITEEGIDVCITNHTEAYCNGAFAAIDLDGSGEVDIKDLVIASKEFEKLNQTND